MTASGPARLLIPLLALLVLGYWLADASHLAWLVPQSPNEGWNAYHARAAMAGALLYPGPPGFFYNNYPPLSFYLVGLAGRLCGDMLLAGRLVSLLAAPAIAACLFLAARRMGAPRGAAALAGLIFLASPWVLSRMAGVDDPQLLGELLDAAALVAIARTPRSAAHIVIAALLLTLAVFVKPLFLALPLALLIWLWGRHRPGALLLAAAGSGFALLGLAATHWAQHADLVRALLAPRLYLTSKIAGQPGQWLMVEALPLVASLALLARPGFGRLAGLYALLAFLFSLYFSGGDGVSASQMIDPALAVALGAGLYLGEAGPRRLLLPAGLALLAAGLLLAWTGQFAAGIVTPAELARERPAAARDIAWLAARRDPVFCDTSALCYWAGKPAVVDGFGLSQAFKTGQRPVRDLTGPLAARRFGAVQVALRSPFAYEPRIAAALAAAYRRDHADALGDFRVP